MVKRIIFCLALALIVASGVFAADTKSNSKNNWISGEISIVGGGFRYERMLNPKISLGVNAYYNTLFFVNDFAADFSFRFYPGTVFFLGVGAGFHVNYWTVIFASRQVIGAAITPEVGWKIDPGDPGGFFMSPGIKVPVIFGVSSTSSYFWGRTTGGIFGVNFGIVPYFGMGFAW